MRYWRGFGFLFWVLVCRMAGAAAPFCTPFYAALDHGLGALVRTDVAVSLADTPFESHQSPALLANAYARTLIRPGQRGEPLPPPMGLPAYLRRLRAFAAETADNRSVVLRMEPDSQGHRATIRLHLGTGEILILDHEGRVSTYAALPFSSGGFGRFTDASDLLHRLFVPAIRTLADGTLTASPRLTVGESLPPAVFSSRQHLIEHFQKHVLMMQEGVSLERFASLTNDRLVPTPFPELRQRFLSEYRAENSAAERTEILEHYSIEYERLANDFLRSTSPHNLSVNAVEENRRGQLEQFTYRFNTVTHDFAHFVLRQDGTRHLITFYRIYDLVPSNHQLVNRQRMPAARNSFEYFLALSTGSSPAIYLETAP